MVLAFEQDIPIMTSSFAILSQKQFVLKYSHTTVLDFSDRLYVGVQRDNNEITGLDSQHRRHLSPGGCLLLLQWN